MALPQFKLKNKCVENETSAQDSGLFSATQSVSFASVPDVCSAMAFMHSTQAHVCENFDFVYE